MNIHEFQAKRILEKYGISVPEFYVVLSLQELENHSSGERMAIRCSESSNSCGRKR